MDLKFFIFSLIFVVALVFLGYNLRRLFLFLKIAQPETRSDNIIKRLGKTLKIAFSQTKIFREKFAGSIHAAIFWGFLLLLFTASEAVIQGFYHPFSWEFLGSVYPVLTMLTDIFCVFILIAILFAAFRRYIFKVQRLQGDKKEVIDGVIVLSSIFIIVVSLLLQNIALSYLEPILFVPETGELIRTGLAVRPVSVLLSGLFTNPEHARLVCEIFWWVHIVAIFGFINYLPYSKHLHVYTSIFNVFFSSLRMPKPGKIDFEQENLEKFGVVDVEDLSWKSLLDGYSCTHCGRCDSVCPANLTGKELSPRHIIINIRQRTFDKAPLMIKQKNHNGDSTQETALTEVENEILNKKFIGDYQSVEALWQCTTCGACMQECPVTIEHIPAIIGMRRSLVMMESNFPTLLQSAFNNLENNSAPWAFSASERADWANGLDIKIAAENPEFDVLFWVGCAGSFDDRAKKISIAFSKLMKIAGIDFAILGGEEMCNGDPARRTGHEYLADMLVKSNIETLKKYKFKKIVTTCPHCFNTLKNEYPDFGANYEVVHHTEFLIELIGQGKIKLIETTAPVKSVTYHDSCYLGRYNNIYSQPRNIIKSIPNLRIAEPARAKDRGLCCGAGGGQMFLEETAGKRINIERTEELLATGASTIVANCPFCMTMLTDGVKAKDKIDEIEVKDVAELILEKLAIDKGEEAGH